MYAIPTQAPGACPEVATASTIRRGPSSDRASANSGSGGTTDIHRVSCKGFGGCAQRLARLPNAQPSPPHTVSRNGHQVAEARCCEPTIASPSTATPTPSARTGVSRSLSSAAPSSTVNGAEDCSTSDARPVGMPCAIAV